MMKKNPYMLLTLYSPNKYEERASRAFILTFYLVFSRTNVYFARFTALPQRHIFPHEAREILMLYPYVISFLHRDERRFLRYYHHVDIFFTSMETSSRAALRGKRRRKEREAGRAEKKRLWHSFPMPTQRDLLDLSIRHAAVLARGNGALDFEKRTEPFRHRVVSY